MRQHDLTISKAIRNVGGFILKESKSFHQSFPNACSALVTDVTKWEHREADDVTSGRCSRLQLPEYNDPELYIIILTLCGISLSTGLQCQFTAVYLLECKKIASPFCGFEDLICHTVFCHWYHENHVNCQKGKREELTGPKRKLEAKG